MTHEILQSQRNKIQAFMNLKCQHKKFHQCFAKHPDGCAYCGWCPMIIDDLETREMLNSRVKYMISHAEATNKLFKSALTKDIQKGILNVFKDIQSDPNKLNEKIMEELDILRNQIFYEGIITNNQCLISMAYDLDELLLNDNLSIIEEIVERFENIVKSENNRCKSDHIDPCYTTDEKLRWYLHFANMTKNFTDVNGWKSPRRFNGGENK